MARMRERIDVPVMSAVGAAFDFHAGRISQAPSWMQDRGLEWTYRIAQEPRRLLPRYLLLQPALHRSRSRASSAATLRAAALASPGMAQSAAIVGLGRIGLPLALSFADRGVDVIGVDKDRARLDTVARGPDAVRGDRHPGAARARAAERAAAS